MADIEHFRDHCSKPRTNRPQIPQDALDALADDVMQGKAEQMDTMKMVKEAAELDKTVHQSARVAAEAIQKELKAEEVEEKEEKQREELELQTLEGQVSAEKNKEKCIKKALKKKARAQERKAKALEVADKITKIKEQTRVEVLKNRDETAKRLNIMRRMQQRKKMNLQKELSLLKMEMTSEMLKAEVEGNANNCSPSKTATEREA